MKADGINTKTERSGQIMKFRMFTEAIRGEKIAVNIDKVSRIAVACKKANTTYIFFDQPYRDDEGTGEVVVEVGEDFDTVFSRLNTIAE